MIVIISILIVINNIINNLNYTNQEKYKIKNELKRTINCNYGINTENDGIKKYETITNNKVYNNNSKLYSLELNNYKICGKVDGFVKLNNKEYKKYKYNICTKYGY